MSGRVNLWGLVGLVVIALATAGLWLLAKGRAPTFEVQATFAEVQTVHPDLSINGKDVRGIRRLGPGSEIKTGPDGRGRARLDDGTHVVIDRNTRLIVTDKGVKLEEGRLFVQAAPSAKTQLLAGDGVAIASGSTVAMDRRGGKTSMFCAAGELTVRAAKGEEQRVGSGETATIKPDGVDVAPEAAFDDWTSGMAVPWGVEGPPRRALGEVWGRVGGLSNGDPGSPLTIRSTTVNARVAHEIALTEVRTTYFNAGSGVVQGDFRMAIPADATVAGFAIERSGSAREATLALASRDSWTVEPSDARLEWAGDGWLRGLVPGITAGATVTVVVRYFEWLSPIGGRIAYRLPLAGDGIPPRIGEFFADIDMGGAQPSGLATGLGAVVHDSHVTLRRSDFVPTADLVVEAALPKQERIARAYVGHASADDEEGDYLVARVEAPGAAADAGVTLSLVVDVSASMDPSMLDASRALVEALIQGLGEKDRLVVLAADQTSSPVGPAEMGALDAKRREAILTALATLSPGGATDLGRALERGADAIPADAPAGMVIYIGDGWPTMGDPSVDAIEARLARRAGGVPRLGAVSVGPLANRFALNALVRGSGPILEIVDREDAAGVAIQLIAEALRPAVAGVEITFPPGVERVYPRGSHAYLAGSTVTVVGRVKDTLPRTIELKWRDAKGARTETVPLKTRTPMDAKEVRRRWAMARVRELAFRAAGREAATEVAFREQLLTPWTAWVIGSRSTYVPTALSTRVLDLASSAGSAYNAMLSTPSATFGALTDPLNEPEEDPKPDDDVARAAMRAAAQRMIQAAGKQIRACRDARAALRPELRGTLVIRVKVDTDGTATQVTVTSSNGADNDDILNRCVEVVVRGLRYPVLGIGGATEVDVRFELPPARTMVGRKCSPASMLPLGLRRGIWLERLRGSTAPADVYMDAKRGCELKKWSDKRVMLELVMEVVSDGLGRVRVARELERLGEDDAAALMRKEAMRRAESPRELWAIRTELIGDEQLPVGTFRKQYRAAATNEARLDVVRKFMLVAPHHGALRRRLFALLEATGKKEALLTEVAQARQDPLADATVLADGAAALRRASYEKEARRAYGELAERAPEDPSVRAFLGDRLRAEGWAEDASAAYAALEELVPDDAATTLRVALAHTDAKRYDIAARMLTRLAQTGGRTGDSTLADLGARIAAAQMATLLATTTLSPDDRERLSRRALEIPWSQPGAVILVRTPRLLRPVEVRLMRGPKDARDERTPDVEAPTLGIASFVVQPGDLGDLEITIRRPDALQPETAVPVHIDVMRAGQDLSEATISSISAEAAADGKVVTYRYDGKTLTKK